MRQIILLRIVWWGWGFGKVYKLDFEIENMKMLERRRWTWRRGDQGEYSRIRLIAGELAEKYLETKNKYQIITRIAKNLAREYLKPKI